jgi:hypothetical protein
VGGPQAGEPPPRRWECTLMPGIGSTRWIGAIDGIGSSHRAVRDTSQIAKGGWHARGRMTDLAQHGPFKHRRAFRRLSRKLLASPGGARGNVGVSCLLAEGAAADTATRLGDLRRLRVPGPKKHVVAPTAGTFEDQVQALLSHPGTIDLRNKSERRSQAQIDAGRIFIKKVAGRDELLIRQATLNRRCPTGPRSGSGQRSSPV